MTFTSVIRALFGSSAARPFMSTGAGREVRLMGNHPTIVITPEALATMHRYVDRCSTEVGWLGTAEWRDDSTILIDRVILFNQHVSGATTRITAEGLHEVAEELLAQGEEGEAILENLRFWGHSHVEMQCFPSSQDDRQMKDFEENGSPFFVRGIFNKNGDVKFDIYDYTRQIIFVDCRWEVLAEIGDDSFQTIDEEIRAKVHSTTGIVTAPTVTPMVQGGGTGRDRGRVRQ